MEMTVRTSRFCLLMLIMLLEAFGGNAARSEQAKPLKSSERPGVRIESVTPSSRRVVQYEKVELRVRFSGTVTDYFDPEKLNIFASVRTPSGRTFQMPGFLADFQTRRPGPPEPVWLVRFTPTEVGQYEYTVTVEAAQTRATSLPMRTSCVENKTAGGFVRLCRTDRRYFELSNGSFFYPIGQNVCWSADYEGYFRKMHASGENFVRVWLCPWNCWLERKDSPGQYDLAAAGRIDDILALAERYELRVQLVLVWYGLLSEKHWATNPYNLVNGGPCESASEFFTNAHARKLFKRKLRYLVARYSASPGLFAWELFNEVDLADHRSWDDIIKWHGEMSRYLVETDPHRNLVTTSAFNQKIEKRLWALSDISHANPHRYAMDPVASVREAAVVNVEHGKPVMVGEFGSAATVHEQAHADPGGVLLHAALWSSFHSPAAGTAAPWWWDTHIKANNLYAHFAALSKYAAGFDRRGRKLRLIVADVTGPDKEKLAVQGMLDHVGGTLWIYETNLLKSPRRSALGAIGAGTTLVITGLLDGPFEVAFWDTRAGEIISKSVVECRKGRLRLSVPAFRADVSVMVRFQGRSAVTVSENDALELKQ